MTSIIENDGALLTDAEARSDCAMTDDTKELDADVTDGVITADPDVSTLEVGTVTDATKETYRETGTDNSSEGPLPILTADITCEFSILPDDDPLVLEILATTETKTGGLTTPDKDWYSTDTAELILFIATNDTDI
jgi:hypothetical protein